MFAVFAAVTAGLDRVADDARAQTETGTGSVTIVKQGLLGDDTATFNHNFPPSGGTFDLSAAENSETFSGLAAGTYSVTEMPLEGYTLTGAGCSLATSRAAPGIQAVPGNTLAITVAEGQSLTCTFVNGSTQELEFDVTILKYVDGAAAIEGDFNFTANWDEPDADAQSGNFGLNAGNGFMAVTSPLGDGSMYSIVENGVDATCEGEDTHSLLGYSIGATAEAAAGGAVGATGSIASLTSDMYIVVWNETCEPVGTGSITIVKEGLLEGDEAVFTHDVPGQGSDTFTLTSADPTITIDELAAGDYNFTETDLVGYTLVSTGCGFSSLAPEAPVAAGTLKVTLGDDEDQTCTFVNAPATQDVTTTKYVDGALALDGSFEFTDSSTAGAFTLSSTNSFSATVEDLPSGGAYSVSETGIDGTCEGEDVYRLAGYGIGGTLEEALAAPLAATAEIAALDADMNVVVHNQLCADLASITIVKDFDPDNTTEASFTTEGLGVEDFSIAEGTEHGMTFENLSPGDYSFDENAIPGWRVNSIFCTGQSSPSNIAINLGGGSAVVTLNAGDNITCTFTNGMDPNAAGGSITVIKDWGEDAGDPTTFSTSANLGGLGSLMLEDSEGSDSQEFAFLKADSYVITETAMDGWTLTGINCTGEVPVDFGVDLTTGALTVNLTEDEVVTCTFTNSMDDVEGGSLTVIKSWGSDAPADVSFTAGANLGDTDNSFMLTGAVPSVMFDGLADDTYEVAETIPEGWTLDSIGCTGNPTSTATVDPVFGTLSLALLADEDVVCTFTNSMDATPDTTSLTIVKDWGEDAGEDTTFSSADLGAAGNSFILTDDGLGGEMMMFDDLTAGTFEVIEAAPTGWTLEGATCTGVAATPVVVIGEGSLSIAIAEGEDVVCTFTNTLDETAETGSLTITKVWVGADAIDTVFTSSTNLGATNDTFTLTGAAPAASFPSLADDTYVVTEVVPTGWGLGITCSGAVTSTPTIGADTVSLVLAGSEDVTCTFTNTSTTGTPETFIPSGVQNVLPPVDNSTAPPANNPVTNNPVTNNPIDSAPPSAVSDSFPPSNTGSDVPSANAQLPSGSVNNNTVAAQQAPAPPSAGNASPANESTPSIVMFLGLAIAAGGLAVVTYGVTRR